MRQELDLGRLVRLVTLIGIAAGVAAPGRGAANDGVILWDATFGEVNSVGRAGAVAGDGILWVAGTYGLQGGPPSALVKLDGPGAVAGTALDGSSGGTDLAFDRAGKLHVIGFGSVVVTPDAQYPTDAQGRGWYARLDATGQVEYATYVPGFATDPGGWFADWSAGVTTRKLALDSAGNVYIAGRAAGGVPTSTSSIQPAPRATTRNDCAVWKLDATGHLAWATYLGGILEDHVSGIVIASDDAPIIVGATEATGFPTTPGAYRTSTPRSDFDAFVTKLSPAGDRILWSTRLGEKTSQYALIGTYASAVALDATGRIWVAGTTNAPTFECRPAGLPYQPGNAAFLVALSADGARLEACKDYSAEDNGSLIWPRSVAFDAAGRLYLSRVHGSTAVTDKLDPADLRRIDRKNASLYNHYLDAFALDAQGSVYGIGSLGSSPGVGAVVKQHPGQAPTIAPLEPITVTEGSTIQLTAPAASDPDGDPLTYSWSVYTGLEWVSLSGSSPTHVVVEGPGFEGVNLVVTDPWGEQAWTSANIEILNAAPSVAPVMGPAGGIVAGTAAPLSASFSDPGRLDTHVAQLTFGDGTTSPATVRETNGTGTATASHAWSVPGVYQVTATVTDDDGASATSAPALFAVYDPAVASMYGSGTFPAPQGTALAAFDVGYRGAAVPTGRVQFQLANARLWFEATELEWVVVANGLAQVAGSGALKDVAGYAFMLTVRDAGTTGDKIRLVIWSAETGEVAFDSQPGDGLLAPPTAVLNGDAIVGAR